MLGIIIIRLTTIEIISSSESAIEREARSPAEWFDFDLMMR